MLTIKVQGAEYYDDEQKRFVTIADSSIDLEHSLVSLSKWEQITEKPFLSATEKTASEALLYVKCMTLTPDVSPDVYESLPQEEYERINDYIGGKMTATWFAEDKNARKSREIVTAELIYYWMIAMNIPFECQNWHLNTLLTLIQVCEQKNKPAKKLSKQELLRRNRTLNQQRQEQARLQSQDPAGGRRS